MNTPEEIQGMLGARSFCVVGASRDPEKYGHAVFRAIQSDGKTVYPVNPNADSIGKSRCYASVGDLPETVEVAVFVVPPDLDQTKLVTAEAGISTVGSSDVEITLGNLTAAVDMLTTPITIPAGDYASYPPEATDINETNATVTQADRISINVDASGTTAEGLMVILEFD